MVATARRRSARTLAWVVATGLPLAGIALAGAPPATAAGVPNAQAAGNFVDATVGGKPADQLARLQYAQAQAPGSDGVQNPLHVTALGAVDLPMTGALQLPSVLGIHLGAANQVAHARTDGFAYGASGAVNNSGGASIGGDNNAYPANGVIDLSANGLSGDAPVPVPGGTSTAAPLGGVRITAGAVSALAQTPAGSGRPKTDYAVADVTLQMASPLLGAALGQVRGAVGSVVAQLTAGMPSGTPLPRTCALTSASALTSPVTLAGGAITLDPADGALAISLRRLLGQLNLDLNHLPPNTDLIALVLKYLTSADGLAAAIQGGVEGLLGPLTSQYDSCRAALQATPVAGGSLTTLLDTVTGGKATLESTINKIAGALAGASGSNPLAPLGTALQQLVAIGANVQPLVKSGTFTSRLDALPKQGMTPPPVPYAAVVRALEITVLPAAGPGGAVTLALGNAAAGPSRAAPAPAAAGSPTAAVAAAETALPRGVPAGSGTPSSPRTPLVLLAAGIALAAAGAAAWRLHR